MESGTGVSVFACGADYTQRFAIRASVRQISVAPQRLVPWRKLGIEYAIGRARHLRHLGDVVDADDVRAVEDARGHRCGRSPNTLFRRSGLPSRARVAPMKPLRDVPTSSGKPRFAKFGSSCRTS